MLTGEPAKRQRIKGKGRPTEAPARARTQTHTENIWLGEGWKGSGYTKGLKSKNEVDEPGGQYAK